MAILSEAGIDDRVREALILSYTQFGHGGTNPAFSLGGYSGQTSGGLAGLAEYAEGGEVEASGIGGLFENRAQAATMDPILEHHYKNIAQGKAVQNDDGSVSTVYTSQVDIEGVPTLIPTVWDGRILSDEEATQRALSSGKAWPTADTHESLRQYDIELHEQMQPMPAEAAKMMLIKPLNPLKR